MNQPRSLVTSPRAHGGDGFTLGSPHERRVNAVAVVTAPLWVVPAAVLTWWQRRYRPVKLRRSGPW